MPPSRPPGVVPLRPLTLGELLDAAVGLLRRNAAALVPAGVVVALAEQALLHPLRKAARLAPPVYLPHADHLGLFWLQFALGLGTEAAAVALLGGLTARAAGPDLLGERLSAGRLLTPRGSRLLPVAVVALVAGIVVAVCALAGLLPWIFGYGLVGLAVPAVVIDRRGPGAALLRSVSLAAKAGMRALWVRVSGYLGWLAVRLVLAVGAPLLLGVLIGDGPWLPWAALGFAVAANALAYPALACLDAVLHLETRMRTEGLDIWLGRAMRRPGARPDLSRVAP